MRNNPGLSPLLVPTALLLLGLPTPAWTQLPEAELKFNQGLAHLQEGRADLALEEFRQAIKKDAKNPYFYKGLGQAYLRLNKFEDAIEAFRKSIDLNPYYVDVHNDLGTALVLAGKREDGKKELLATFNNPMNPTPEVSSRNLGQAYFEEKSYAEAYKWFQTSLKKNNRYPDAHLGLADTLVAMGRLDEAILQLEVAADTLPDDPNLLLALGEAYYRAGRFSEARTQLEKVARKDPSGGPARRALELLKNFPK